jgi:hypothetical protein
MMPFINFWYIDKRYSYLLLLLQTSYRSITSRGRELKVVLKNDINSKFGNIIAQLIVTKIAIS